MELSDYWATVNAWIDNGDHGHRDSISRASRPSTKLISITSVDLLTKANYQDFQRFQVIDVQMAADAEATLPALIEAVKAAIPDDRKAAIEKRGEASRKAKPEARERNQAAMAIGLGREPDQHGAADHGDLGADQGSRLVDGRLRPADRAAGRRGIWPMEKHYHHLGHSGGFGLGYNLSAAVGAALANRPHGRFSVNLQPDGDFMYSPGRAVDGGAPPDPDAHGDAQQPRLPSGGDARAAPVQPPQPGRQPGQDHGPDRHLDRGPGHRLRQDGAVDGLVGRRARSRIRPSSAPTLKRAVEVVKSGQPALVDVWTQPR